MTEESEEDAISEGTPGDLGDAWAELRKQAGAGERGFPTGYSVDDKCGRQRPGELALLWARAGIGKSTLVMNVLARSPQVPTVVFTLEMPPYRLLEWLLPLVNDLEVDQREIEHVLASETDVRRPGLVAAAERTIAGFPLLTIRQLSRPGVADLVRACDDVYDATGVPVQRVFIDHLTLMRGCAGSKEAIEATTSELKAWTTRDSIGVLVIQQTGRSGGTADGTRNDGHLPVTLSSGIYGGESDADWIFGAYRPDRDPKFNNEDTRAKHADAYERVRNVTRLQVVKNRPYGTLLERGIDLVFQDRNRRLIERGETWSPHTMEGQS